LESLFLLNIKAVIIHISSAVVSTDVIRRRQ
jgi:hypothetical protein